MTARKERLRLAPPCDGPALRLWRPRIAWPASGARTQPLAPARAAEHSRENLTVRRHATGSRPSRRDPEAQYTLAPQLPGRHERGTGATSRRRHDPPQRRDDDRVTATSVRGVELRGPVAGRHTESLAPEALEFLALLHRTFDDRRRDLLERRARRHREIEAGAIPDFSHQTREIRERDWTVAPIPRDLLDRRVEITGPAERKMIINALNSGASVFMADFEDAHSPTWTNNLDGQVNLQDAVRAAISFTSPEGKHYALNERTAVLFVRPRGWHLPEKHLLVDGRPMAGALFDFGLFFFHNAAEQIARGTGPYFYLPKLQSHLEARLWNDVFLLAQERLGVPRGTIRATVLIETIHAAFEMDEILWELREHSAGLNCGRWDYIFSFIKTFRAKPEFVLPDRAQVTMDKAFLHAYVELLIRTCHHRGVHAMGGMAAQIPIRNDPAASEQALAKVRADKLREVRAGHDGTWVAHPGLVPVARAVFDEHMPSPNQIANRRDDVRVAARDLLQVPAGTITQLGLRTNVDVGIQYLEAWLGGNGCVPIYNLMEDAATAEISRTQVWQWLRHGARLEDGRPVTRTLVEDTIAEELASLRARLGAERFDRGRFTPAAKLFEQLMTGREFTEFLTLVAYDHLD
ncbi:MAG: malate synthase A [Gemmatimonadetes bacterium]|nr:malate synthase A [Gemmatimonadota bacterium]